MTALYAVAAEYQDAARKLADMDLDAATIADTLESLSGALEEKAQSVAHVVRAMEADAAAVKQWAKDANERAAAIQKRADDLRDYLSRNLQACGMLKVQGPGVSLSFRKSTACDVFEPALIPAEFMTQPEAPPPQPAKLRILEALKSGQDVPGARLDVRMNLAIK